MQDRAGSVVRLDRCPKAFIRDDAPEAEAQIGDFRWLQRYGVAPREGGRLAQDAAFIDAVDVFESELHREARFEAAQQAKRRPNRGAPG